MRKKMRKMQNACTRESEVTGRSRYEILLACSTCCCGHWLLSSDPLLVTVHTHTERQRERKSQNVLEKVKKTFGKSQYVLEKVKKTFWKKSIRFGKSQYVLEKVNTFWKSQGMNSQKTAGVLACSENRRPLLERVCLPGAK
jgi:hypothetical protein